jgi:uncharacterized SAM-binding protein YcdF (DUF218 family)
MFWVAKVAGYFLAPLTWVFALALLALLLAARRRSRQAVVAGALATAVLWVASMPALAQFLTMSIEDQYAARPTAQYPRADAILILGGALAGAWPPRRPVFGIGPSAGRVWQAAALYREGKAPWVIISGGNQPDSDGQQTEADAISEMLQVLGVPPKAIKSEGTSRNTRENAANIREVVREVRARRVLFVTSASHMPRALRTFERSWKADPVELVPVPTDVQVPGSLDSLKVWFPSLDALEGVTKALKEIAGMAAVAMIP